MQQLASDNRRITTWLHLGPHDTKGIDIQLDDLLMVVGPHIPKVVRGRLSTLTLPHFVYVDHLNPLNNLGLLPPLFRTCGPTSITLSHVLSTPTSFWKTWTHTLRA